MARTPGPLRSLVHRMRRFVDGPQDDGSIILRSAIRERHPAFVEAVRADARVAVRRRGDESDPAPGRDLVRVLRLMLVTDSFFAQVCYRGKAAAQAKGIPVLPQLLHHLAISTGQICIGDPVVVHPGVYIPHGFVVLDARTTVHAGVTLSPFTTLGRVEHAPGGPTIGALATIGTGAKVVGPVTIGARARVGANSVVTRDVPADATAVGVPATVLSPRGERAAEAGPDGQTSNGT